MQATGKSRRQACPFKCTVSDADIAALTGLVEVTEDDPEPVFVMADEDLADLALWPGKQQTQHAGGCKGCEESRCGISLP